MSLLELQPKILTALSLSVAVQGELKKLQPAMAELEKRLQTLSKKRNTNEDVAKAYDQVSHLQKPCIIRFRLYPKPRINSGSR